MWIKKFINKKKAEARFGICKAKLEFLTLEFLKGTATKVDKKHWDNEINILKDCIKYLPDYEKELIYYEVIYKQYKKVFFEK